MAKFQDIKENETLLSFRGNKPTKPSCEHADSEDEETVSLTRTYSFSSDGDYKDVPDLDRLWSLPDLESPAPFDSNTSPPHSSTSTCGSQTSESSTSSLQNSPILSNSSTNRKLRTNEPEPKIFEDLPSNSSQQQNEEKERDSPQLPPVFAGEGVSEEVTEDPQQPTSLSLSVSLSAEEIQPQLSPPDSPDCPIQTPGVEEEKEMDNLKPPSRPRHRRTFTSPESPIYSAHLLLPPPGEKPSGRLPLAIKQKVLANRRNDSGTSSRKKQTTLHRAQTRIEQIESKLTDLSSQLDRRNRQNILLRDENNILKQQLMRSQTLTIPVGPQLHASSLGAKLVVSPRSAPGSRSRRRGRDRSKSIDRIKQLFRKRKPRGLSSP